MRRLFGPLTLLSLAVICLVVYERIGSQVLEDGTLVEPFYLVGIGSFLCVIAGVWMMILGLLFIIRTVQLKKMR